MGAFFFFIPGDRAYEFASGFSGAALGLKRPPVRDEWSFHHFLRLSATDCVRLVVIEGRLQILCQSKGVSSQGREGPAVHAAAARPRALAGKTPPNAFAQHQFGPRATEYSFLVGPINRTKK